MRNYKIEIYFLILIFLGSVFWISAVGIGEKSQDIYDCISLRFESNPYNMEKFDQILQSDNSNKYAGEITSWTQKNGQEIKDKRNNTIKSDVIYIHSSNTACNKFKLYSDNSCAISKDKAYELWHSEDVLGKIVYIDGREYVITEVLKNFNSIIFAAADKYDKDINFIALEIRPPVENTDRFLENFKAENALEVSSSINYNALSRAVYDGAFIPGLILFIIMSVKIICGLILHKKDKKLLLCMFLILFTWIYLNIKIYNFSFTVPESFIPTRWSNFDFWDRIFKNLSEKLRQIDLMKVYYPDEYFKKLLLHMLFNVLLSSMCLMAGIKYVKINNINKLIITEIFVLVIIFLAYTSVLLAGNLVMHTKEIMIAVPVYMLFDYFLRYVDLSRRI